jgi:hypothetical protein
MKLVDLGHCHTCGQSVDTAIDWESFITPDGKENRVIHVEGHCGIPGHATKVKSVNIHDLDDLPNWGY